MPCSSVPCRAMPCRAITIVGIMLGGTHVPWPRTWVCTYQVGMYLVYTLHLILRWGFSLCGAFSHGEAPGVQLEPHIISLETCNLNLCIRTHTFTKCLGLGSGVSCSSGARGAFSHGEAPRVHVTCHMPYLIYIYIYTISLSLSLYIYIYMNIFMCIGIHIYIYIYIYTCLSNTSHITHHQSPTTRTINPTALSYSLCYGVH